ncbi:hypothetical protein NKI41_20395 [Mesorhizobium sp. M0601]|uniref:hypothetical protein n=1 Tax=unclassified Mesorhizobium TaxID=325217 RepID=UPI00333D5963
MSAGAHNLKQRCTATTSCAFISGIRNRNPALPYFAHMVATWILRLRFGIVPKACVKGGFV